jgi:hypothetical protein
MSRFRLRRRSDYLFGVAPIGLIASLMSSAGRQSAEVIFDHRHIAADMAWPWLWHFRGTALAGTRSWDPDFLDLDRAVFA